MDLIRVPGIPYAVSNLKVNEDNPNIYQAHFDSQDVTALNLFRRSMLTEIPTFTIEYVRFFENNSARPDEILAMRFGQLVINNDKFTGGDNFSTIMRVAGPKVVTTDDIPEIPFSLKTPIVTLREQENLVCQLTVKKDVAYTHAKWCPISTFTFEKDDSGFKFTFKTINMLSPRKIVIDALLGMKSSAQRPAVNIFSRTLIPAELKLNL